MHIKKEIRVLGIDDGYFDKFKDEYTIIVGVVTRGPLYVDGILSRKVEVDGWDSTEKIIDMVTKSRFGEEIRVIITDGISFGGFNIIDLEKVYKETGVPIIAVTRKMPNFELIKRALMHLGDWKERWKLIKKLGEPKKLLVKDGYVYYQRWGIRDEDVKILLRKLSVNSRIPEPVRIAHLIAEGITLGESKGKP